LVNARILLSAGEGSQATIVLRIPRASKVGSAPRPSWRKTPDFYRIRAEVENQRSDGRAAGRSRDLLVGRGRPLAEAESLVRRFPEEVPAATSDFVRRSVRRARLWQSLTGAAAAAVRRRRGGGRQLPNGRPCARKVKAVAARETGRHAAPAGGSRTTTGGGTTIIRPKPGSRRPTSCWTTTARSTNCAAAWRRRNGYRLATAIASMDFFAGRWHVVQKSSSTYVDWRPNRTCVLKSIVDGGRSVDFEECNVPLGLQARRRR